jgi:hypothetical protein
MEDCGCEDEKYSLNLKNINFDDGVGENIFQNDDIFDKVKNYYKEYTSSSKNDEEDLLLENLNSSKKDEFKFVEELKKISLVPSREPALLNKEVISLVPSREPALLNKEEINIEEEKEEVIVSNEMEEKKIDYIKDYLDKLKNGTE